MTHIKIEWLTDEHDCEDCGTSYVEGAMVYFDGVPCIDLAPSAHCYDATNYSTYEVLTKIIERLGHTIEDVYEGDEP